MLVLSCGARIAIYEPTKNTRTIQQLGHDPRMMSKFSFVVAAAAKASRFGLKRRSVSRRPGSLVAMPGQSTGTSKPRSDTEARLPDPTTAEPHFAAFAPACFIRREYSPWLAVINSVLCSLPPKLTLAGQNSGAAMGATRPPVFVK